MSWPFAFVIMAIIIIAIYMEVLPDGMIGAFLFLLAFGELLNFIGDNVPIVNTYLGGGAIVTIFGGAALVHFGIINENIINLIDNFMKSGDGEMGFLDFYIAALITGSILGMNRKLLIKAAIRYLPAILGAVIAALGLVSIVAPLFGFTPGEAMAYIGIPIMGGGMGAGAVPISEVFSKALNIPAEQILGKLVPAVALGNAMAIVSGGLLNRLGKSKPQWTGNGQLMISDDEDIKAEIKDLKLDAKDYATGLAIATAFFTFGGIVAKIIASLGLNLHQYAWMIISVAIVKAFNLLPEKYTDACAGWYNFIAKNFTPLLLLGIGISYTSLSDIINAVSVQYVILVALVIIGAILGAALVGKLVGFYPIEAAITAGLCMANMGGTGDVAVLNAADRMVLMPFAQISSRLGGAFIILIASLLVPLFFG
ncbi:MAG: 2-hydroxycarboxylate transporter family protein [Peptoniphilaceae bacterium]|nr:2-hydroxycarboxylate transporter family protein [Peptoniphilaceae bacterium]MDY6019544.1 2-hydroxycarboxylate transporter family protein [Anaerococcus sp.]